MMEKNSNENIVCAYCDKDAIPGTNPPVCEDHISHTQEKKASAETEANSLKELHDM